MQFCDSCGSAMVQIDDEWICRECDPDRVKKLRESDIDHTPPSRSADLSRLPTTDSGAVRKEDAMDWLASLDEPTEQDIVEAIQPKPNRFSGSTYATSISNVRITGDPKFVETIAGLFTAYQQLENSKTRVEINLQQTEDKETGELTDNYALYLSVAERG